MGTKVKVINTTNHEVSVLDPQTRFSRVWAGNSFAMIDKEILEQLVFQNGFKNAINQGILYIEDLDVKKELFLEPEDATKPVNIIVLNDTDRKAMMTTYTIEAFQEKLAKLGSEQIQMLADYAVKNRYTDYDKCELIRKACGRDILKAIRLSDLDKEEIKTEN